MPWFTNNDVLVCKSCAWPSSQASELQIGFSNEVSLRLSNLWVNRFLEMAWQLVAVLVLTEFWGFSEVWSWLPRFKRKRKIRFVFACRLVKQARHRQHARYKKRSQVVAKRWKQWKPENSRSLVILCGADLRSTRNFPRCGFDHLGKNQTPTDQDPFEWSQSLKGGGKRSWSNSSWQHDPSMEQSESSLAEALTGFLQNWQKCASKTEGRPPKKPKQGNPPKNQGSLISQLQTLLADLTWRQAADNTVAQELTSMLKKGQRGERSQNQPTAPEKVVWEPPKAPAQTYCPQMNQRQVFWESKHEKTVGKPPVGNIASFTPGEWTSPPKITQVSQVLGALADAKDLPGKLVVIKEEHQLQELLDMWAATSSKAPLTVIFDGDPQKESEGTKIKMSVKRAKSLIAKLETLTAWRLGDEAKCPWISQAKKTDFKNFKPTPKVTVRFTAPQHFRLAFTDGFGDQKPIDIII